MLVWVYFDLDAQDIRSLAPVFKLDNPEVFHECEFTKLLPLTNEIFLFWRETLYSTVFTSAGEVAIKKVRAVLSEADMLNILRLEGAFEAEDVYPVELYSLQQEKFACICWSIEQKERTLMTLSGIRFAKTTKSCWTLLTEILSPNIR